MSPQAFFAPREHVEKEKEKGRIEEKSTLEVSAFRFELSVSIAVFKIILVKNRRRNEKRSVWWFLMRWRAECLLQEARITNANRNDIFCLARVDNIDKYQ